MGFITRSCVGDTLVSSRHICDSFWVFPGSRLRSSTRDSARLHALASFPSLAVLRSSSIGYGRTMWPCQLTESRVLVFWSLLDASVCCTRSCWADVRSHMTTGDRCGHVTFCLHLCMVDEHATHVYVLGGLIWQRCPQWWPIYISPGFSHADAIITSCSCSFFIDI